MQGYLFGWPDTVENGLPVIAERQGVAASRVARRRFPLFVFAEPVRHEVGDGFDRPFSACGPVGRDLIVVPIPAPEGSGSHDGCCPQSSPQRDTSSRNRNFDALHEFRRRAGVKPLLVDDRQLPDD